MIHVLGVLIENFRSWHGRHYIPLSKRGLTAVMGANRDAPVWSPSNGAGKSGIVTALRWCLYGEIDASADSVVNDLEGANTTVTVRLIDDDGRLVVVERFRARKKVKPATGLRLSVNGSDVGWTMLDVAKTQEKLEEILGMDVEIFHAAVLFHQAGGARTAFVDMGDAEAKQVLTRILPIGAIDAAKELVDKELSQRKQDIAVLQAQLATHHTIIIDAQARLRSAEADSARWESERAQRLEQLRAELHAVGTEGKDVRARLDALGAAVQIPWPTGGAVAQNLAAARRLVEHVRGRIATYSAELQHVCGPTAGFCAACGQSLPGVDPAERADQIRKAIDGLERRDLADAMATLQQAEAASEALAQAQIEARAQQMATAATDDLRRQLAHRRHQLLQRWEELEASVRRDQQLVNPFHERAARDHQQMVSTQAFVSQLEQQLVALTERSLLLEWWSGGFGRSGLKSFVLDAYLETMTAEANRWVQIITGGRGWVRFETQRATSNGKKLTEQFTVRCFVQQPDGTTAERNIRDGDSWSGGERQRFALAVDFALARLVAGRARRAWDILILDEVFRYIDAGGKQAFVEVLRQLTAEKSTVLVVDHDPTFTAYCDDAIVVEKINGCSRVMAANEERDAEESETFAPDPRRPSLASAAPEAVSGADVSP